MSDDEGSANVSPATISVPAQIPTPTVSMRNYFSTYLIHAARERSSSAASIEAMHSGQSRFDVNHRGDVLASILCSAAFLEAMINELYQDAYDGHLSYISPLAESGREMMKEFWRSTNGRHHVLGKYQMALLFNGRPQFDAGAQPYQDAALVLRLRNAIAHYQPESLTAGIPSDIEAILKGKFADNALISGSGNPWWPDKALGHGCAEWAARAVVLLADQFSRELKIEPNYRVHGYGLI